MPSDIFKLNGNVGFATLPDQLFKISYKVGFHFNILVIGESGLGKSTVINTLFEAPIYPSKQEKPITDDCPTDVQIQSYTCEMSENKVNLKLTVIDALGFGDFLDNSKSWQPVLKNIEDKLEAYFEQESRVNRKKIIDNRVHCCLYFISPYGHNLKANDIETMKKIHDRVPLIPIIAKADTLTPEEREEFKKRVLEDIKVNNINIFSLDLKAETDKKIQDEKKKIQAKFPFAVIGGNTEKEVNGKKVKGRNYPWGFISCEDEKHSDLPSLRALLIGKFTEDLKISAEEVHYERYRTERLAQGQEKDQEKGKETPRKVDLPSSSPLSAFEEEKRQYEEKLQKMEKDFQAELEKKKKEREDKLAQASKAIADEENDLKAKLEEKSKELTEKKKQLDEAMAPKTPEKKSKKKSGLF